VRLLSPAIRTLAIKGVMLLDRFRRHKITILALFLVVAALAVVVVTSWPLFGSGEAERLHATAVAAHRSAESKLQSNQVAEADRLCRSAIEGFAKILTRSSKPQVCFEKATALETLAAIQTVMDQPDEAVLACREAIKLYDKLLFEDPHAVEIRERVGQCVVRFAPMLIKSGRTDDAERILEHGANTCLTRLTIEPPDPRLNDELVWIRNQLGLLLHRTFRLTAALEHFAGAVELQSALVTPSSTMGEDRALLISIMMNQAEALSAARQPDAAERVLVKSREVAEKLCADFPTSNRYRDLNATVLESEAAQIARGRGRASEARRLLERAFDIRDSLVAISPTADFLDKLAETCHRLADSFFDAKSFERAEEFQRKELNHRLRLDKDHPGLLAYRFGRGEALHNLAELLRQRGRAAKALPLEREAAPLLAEVYRENVLDEEHRRAVSHAYWTLCTLELDKKDHRAAAQAVTVYQSIEPNGFEEAHEAAGFLCRCVLLCRDDHELPATDKERLARSYADRAIAALEAAVRGGFRDLKELEKSRTYEPLRGRPDFSSLVKYVAEIDQAVSEG
jgi:tetratricopeptide (TPR) repeat protein